MENPATIPDGIYKVVFTSSADTATDSICMVKESKFAGADFISSYTGQFTYDGGMTRAWMRRRRHGADVVAKLKLPMEFDLIWQVRMDDSGIVMETTYPLQNLRVIATLQRIA